MAKDYQYPQALNLYPRSVTLLLPVPIQRANLAMQHSTVELLTLLVPRLPRQKAWLERVHQDLLPPGGNACSSKIGGSACRLRYSKLECAHLLQVWGAKDVFYNNLNACKQVGNALLGFHEPELSSGASMSVQVSSSAMLSHHIMGRHRTYTFAGPHRGILGCLAWPISSARLLWQQGSNYL